MTGLTGRLDKTTGLYDWPLLEALLTHEIAQTHRYGNPLAVMRMGLHNVDRMSQETRDIAKGLVAQVLSSALRSADMAGHFEQDFVVLLPYTDEEGGVRLAERLAETVQSLQASDSSGNEISFSVCVGVTAPQSTQESSPTQLVQLAGQALQAAQQRGPHSIVGYSSLER